jgi:hypothetical protein
MVVERRRMGVVGSAAGCQLEFYLPKISAIEILLQVSVACKA